MTSPKKKLRPFARYSSIAVVCLWAFSANAENLITNGTFDDPDTYGPWWGYTANSSTQVLAVTDGWLCSTIDNGAKNYWDVLLGYSKLSLAKDQNYHIKFSAKSEPDRTIHMKTGLGAAPYTDYFMRPVKFTADPKDYEFTYLNLREDPDAQFQFQIGGSTGTVCFDEIVFEPVDPPKIDPYKTPAKSGRPMKDYASTIKIGTAVDTPAFLSMPLHNSIVAGEFNLVTPANSMKMNNIQPTKGTFDFAESDAIFNWAQENNLEFRGHPLVWHTQAPSWLKDGTFDRDAMTQVMYDHIDTLVGHFKGKVKYWDVVNEAIEKGDDDVWGFRKTIWSERIGEDFIELAFKRAHEADPDAKLFYNDYNIEQKGNPKADKVFEMVKDLKAKGVPISGVGFQGHYYVTPDGGTEGVPDIQAIRDNMARFKEIGIDVHITECDFRIGLPLTDEKVNLQKKFYADMLKACIDAPNCDHFVVWGLSDIDSWVPSTFAGYDSAHLFDSDFKAKPAYFAMAEVLAATGTGGSAAGGSTGTAAGGSTGTTSSSAGGTTSSSAAGGSVGTTGPHVSEPPTTSDSGCALHGSGDNTRTPWQAGLFAMLGLSLLFRRRQTARNRS